MSGFLEVTSGSGMAYFISRLQHKIGKRTGFQILLLVIYLWDYLLLRNVGEEKTSHMDRWILFWLREIALRNRLDQMTRRKACVPPTCSNGISSNPSPVNPIMGPDVGILRNESHRWTKGVL